MFEGTRSAAKLLRRKTQSRAQRHDDGFKTDGCTGVPDFWFYEACKEHDWDYRIGGDEEDRKEADQRLRRRIQHRSWFGWLSPWSWLVYGGVRLLGSQHFNYTDD